ncbi:MAG: VCBS repeat-containing protein, partial [Bacteroidales bacterium]|nr:VCBS repeat-containing protein [Bacteroidales bacterium]
MKNLYIILITVFLFQIETKLTAQNPLPLNPKNINTEAEVGTLSGTFAVGQTGAATYTIPIDLPEGRAGMTPKLSLVYNSQAGDGILGKGWSISGWTYVDRVPETFYYNDNPGSIDFDEDQYTLDGKRLIFVADLGGTYSEVEYRTEQDEISKIIQQFAYKKDRTHSKFFVYTKSGIIKEYGTFENSLQVYGYNNNEAIRYHLSKIIDKKHNYIKYHYQRDITEGELYLDLIEYTGNDLIGKDPFYTVKFEYTPNDTKFFKTSYFAKGNDEYHYRVSQKLNAISIYYLENEQETLIKRYVISYSDGGIFNKPYVTGIYLENENNQLNSTEFQWNFNEAFEFNEQHVYSTEPVLGHIVNMLRVSSGDFNGDGISDIIEGDKQNGMDLRLGGSLSSIESHSQDNISDHRYVVDINCDGKDELLVYWAITGYGRLYSFEYNGSQYEFNFVGEVYGLNPKIIGDFNGDKMQDFIVESSGSNLLYLGTPNINEFLTNSFSLNYLPELTNYEIGDFNGDGKTDIIEIGQIAAKIYTLKHGSSGYYFEEYGSDEDIREEASVTFTDISAGDFNGDGRDDLLITRFFENDDIFLSHIYYSYGKEFITGIDVSPLSYYNKNHVIVDLNYDGISDILTYTIETNVFPNIDVRIRQSKYYKLPGTNQSFEIYTGVLEYDGSTSNEKYLPESFALGDFSGNGELDMYYTLIFELDAWEKNPPPVYWHREAYKVTEDLLGDDLITSITNGFGSIIDIQYLRFINSGSSQASPTEYPVVNFTDPFYVVTQIESDNGQGGTLPPIEYGYKGAKFHAKGKGFLGFQNTTIKNYQNNTITSAEFSIFAENDLYFHPYPENIKQHSFINNQRETDKLLMETQNTFNIKTTITGKPKIYLPVITQSFQKVWDNDDEHTFVKTIKTIQNIDFDLDIYGNSLKQTILTDPANLAESAPNSEYDFKTIVENLYIIDEPNWLVGRPLSSEGTNIYIDNEDNFVRTEYSYYEEGSWPLLENKKITPNYDTKYETEVWYVYDEYGNITKETFKAPNADPYIAERVTEYEYSVENGYNARFLTKTIKNINGIEYATQYEYYKEIGKLKKEIVLGGPVPLETIYEYDDFGKLQITNHPDGTSSETYFFWSEGNDDAPLNALFYTINHKRMAGPIPTEYEKVITFYDNLERDLRQVTYGLNNEKIYVEKEYNAKGQLWKVSEPYFSSSLPQQWTVFEYDKLGRKKTTTTPANSYTY